jgi:hypothetical protein
MRKWPITFFALAAALAIAPPAKADTFDFSFTDGAVSGSGTLTGTYEGAGSPWLITGCTACTFDDGDDGGSVTLIPNPAGPGGSSTVGSGPTSITYDDLLDLFQVSGSYLDNEGLLFGFDDGDYVNVFFAYSVGGTSTVYYGWYDSPQGDGDYSPGSGSFTITSYDISASETPEPGTLPLMATGLLALAFMLLRKSSLSGLFAKT